MYEDECTLTQTVSGGHRRSTQLGVIRQNHAEEEEEEEGRRGEEGGRGWREPGFCLECESAVGSTQDVSSVPC